MRKSLTRLQAEKAMLKKLAEIVEIYLQYDPNAEYLSATYLNGHLSIDNASRACKRIDTWLDVNSIRNYASPLRADDDFKRLTKEEQEFFLKKLR